MGELVHTTAKVTTDRTVTASHNPCRDFGFNISPQMVALLIRKFDSAGRRAITFDSFIQCCVMLQILTSVWLLTGGLPQNPTHTPSLWPAGQGDRCRPDAPPCALRSAACDSLSLPGLRMWVTYL